jgi:hypothetical protein
MDHGIQAGEQTASLALFRAHIRSRKLFGVIRALKGEFV